LGERKRAALYVRVSTDRQTVQNQIAALRKVAEGRGWEIVATFRDEGISGAKGRSERPGLDEMLKQAQRGAVPCGDGLGDRQAGKVIGRSAPHHREPEGLRGRSLS
jgi:hypothetical protein